MSTETLGCFSTKEVTGLSGQGAGSVYCNPLPSLLTKSRIPEAFPSVILESHGLGTNKKRTDSQGNCCPETSSGLKI